MWSHPGGQSVFACVVEEPILSGGGPRGVSGDEAFLGVRLCRVPRTVGRIGHAQPVQVGIEVGVANSQSGDCCVQCPVGGIGPPVVSCVLSDVSQ
ncbi:hypothetical protein E2C01_032201 [Portunus trituberculatus]|uniref:Uncharacterized protein n=1 Tax=Portunus trituberculatus TaxID=210409 RepID=A0A5B7EUS2_PORTR|nr:hypothetical protein [Portunus trituberculatus]